MAVEDDDPGWPGARKAAFGVLVPGLAIRRARAGGDGLVTVRTLFVSFCAAIVLIGVLVVVLGGQFDPTLDGVVAVVATAVVGALAQVGGRVFERPLPCDPAALGPAYMTRFFLRIATSESAALVGFVFTILSGNQLVYFVGAAIAAIGFVRAAPTAAHLAADQQALQDGGCGESLVAALRG